MRAGDLDAGSVSVHPADPHRHTHHTRHALSAAPGQLAKQALKLLGYVVLAFLVFKLIPSLKQALHSLEHVSGLWIVGAVALEVVSEMGYVLSWRVIVDPDDLLDRDGRGRLMRTRVAWAQLGGGVFVPGGTLATVGVGTWMLHRLGMPTKQIAERQFNLSFLNTAVDALTMTTFGVLLAIGIFAGTGNLLLTLLPAAVVAGGLAGALWIGHRAEAYSARVQAKHPKVAAAITTLAAAVDDTDQLLFHRGDWKPLLGALAYLGFDTLVLFSAFFAINAHPIPAYGVVVMAYIIGALGGSIPLPANIGAIGGIAGMLIVYGVARNPAVAAVVIYEAIGLLVPLIGGGVSYLFLRRQFGQIPDGTAEAEAVSAAP
jgi:uncharacterized membrane protein YbhN (UPF0104 family)